MRKLVTFFLVLGLITWANKAEACVIPRAMQPQDYAVADVIFEGKIKEVFPVFKYNDYLKKDQVISAELQFDIDKTLRGELPEKTVLVGYRFHTFGALETVEDFIKRHGENVRVGLVTPRQSKLFCRTMTEDVRRGGKKVTQEYTDCDFGLPAYYERFDDIPFVHTAPCANQFIFDLSKPVVTNSHDLLAERRAIPINIFREHPKLFTVDLTVASPEMKELVGIGLERYEVLNRNFRMTKKERREYQAQLKTNLQKEFLVFASLQDLDPALRERFLRDDLANTEH